MLGDHEDTLPGLKSADDATGIRHRLLLAFEYAESEPDPTEQARLLTFVVVGGGDRGIEIAGDVAELANGILAQDLYSIPPGTVRVTLVEAKPRLLPGLPYEISNRMHELLEKHGGSVRVGAHVDAIASDHVMVGGERIETRTVVWAAASQPPVAGEPEPARSWNRAGPAAVYRNATAACARQLAVMTRMLMPTRQGHRI